MEETTNNFSKQWKKIYHSSTLLEFKPDPYAFEPRGYK